ncbi:MULTISPECIES: TIGR04222 domain-containing membrane protein [Actinosynnema]|uniref:TIGR04222 domain-containing membrane protein n=1 Tax=Actinosynnema TaxID=40566 RepID=UPI0020A4DC6D|nr:TIGR04222 domain-containing membrane protein [Actinosynnema pretiosum]MCP2095497.1 TIGR04222 domain-containing protein [Actinosynnema pretiosum]
MASAVRAEQLHPEEVACLVGGPRRVAEVAVAALSRAGVVRVSRNGVVSAVSGGGARTGPQAAVLARSGQALGDVVVGVAAGDEARSVRPELVRRGLMRTPGRQRALFWARPLVFLVVVLAAVCAFALELLVPVALAVLALGVVLNVVLALRQGPLTGAGKRVLRQARQVPAGLPDGPERIVAARGLLGRHDRKRAHDLVGVPAGAVKSLTRSGRPPSSRRADSSSGGASCSSGCGGGFSSDGGSGGGSCGSGDSGGGGGCGGGGGD